ncbi:uncharacterized protein LOC124158258 [Ischnura elegans]|uniref:uncharacterized protein LOC124158258 n=1 Tax=Ischnura elegans TaxID=197161 RepID=UPI001ED89A6A|nr:uncharacterized protein LOC124158258 [Ischnura elegans]
MANNPSITDLWNLETIGISDPVAVKSAAEEDAEAISYYKSTVRKEEMNGRYNVALPWKQPKSTLPTNRQVAEKRLRSATAKLEKTGNWIHRTSSTSAKATLYLLKPIRITHYCQLHPDSKEEIHIFCDASGQAYATVIYLRSEYEGEVKVKLLNAKSRLAPVKKPTINRLELLAALLGARMARPVKEVLGKDIPFHYWSDSTTVLAWIKRGNEWEKFVSNRVKEILDTTTTRQWNHVPGEDNPADLPSRGCTPAKLVESKWWEGPKWLTLTGEHWPCHTSAEINEDEINKERKKMTVSMISTAFPTPRFSSCQKNVTVWAWVNRFTYNCRNKKRITSPIISTKELRLVEKTVLKEIQCQAYGQGGVPKNLLTVMGTDGLLRIMSKLVHREDTTDFISPILLPQHRPLVITYLFLFGIFTSSTVMQGFRLLRHEAKAFEVETATLPVARVQDSKVFQTTGVDLAGPLIIRDGQKVWIVIYTCAVYRCVSLDVITGLSTETFLNSLERFVANYGRPNTVYSDNGTNFIGAKNIFDKLNMEEVAKISQVKKLQWILNCEAAPWWGGFWERLIRSVKGLMKRMIGKSKLSFDELRTCIASMAATINDRPLTTITEDGNDLVSLSPAMFLRHIMPGGFPEGNFANGLEQSYRKMHNLQTQLKDRFRKEYLSLLIQKRKKVNIRPTAVGDGVLVGCDNKKRFEWPLGKIEELFSGKDGIVRSAKIKIYSGKGIIYINRPLHRLYPLEISQQEGAAMSTTTPILEETSSTSMEQPVKKAENKEEFIITRGGRKVKKLSRYSSWFGVIIT